MGIIINLKSSEAFDVAHDAYKHSYTSMNERTFCSITNSLSLAICVRTDTRVSVCVHEKFGSVAKEQTAKK